MVTRPEGFVFCRECGHYSQAKLRGLAGNCSGPLPFFEEQSAAERKRALYRARLMEGLHPLTGRALQD